MKWDEWVNVIIICKNRGTRQSSSLDIETLRVIVKVKKVEEKLECNLTDFNALINSHSSFETSVLKVLYTSCQ